MREKKDKLGQKLDHKPPGLSLGETTKQFYVDEIDNPYNTQIGGDHYKEYPFCQPLEFFSKNKISFTVANVCKYALRHRDKNGIEDLRKAKHYLQIIAWDEYGEVL